MLLALSLQAFAVPVQLNHQGRMLDGSGLPLNTNETVTFALYTQQTGGTSVWSQDMPIAFDEGYFTAVLGADSLANPIDDSLFDNASLFVSLTIGGVELDRQHIKRVPLAVRAITATNLEGGVVDATEIRIDGNTVIDSGGLTGTTLDSLVCAADQVAVFDGSNWTCQSLGGGSVAWTDITGIPPEFADQIDDDQLSGLTGCLDGQVPTFIAAGGVFGCGDLDWTHVANVPADFADGIDNVLDEAAVDAFVANNGYALDADIAAVGKSGDFADLINVPAFALDADISAIGKSGDWTDLLSVPPGFADNVDDDTLGGISCADGELIAFDGTSSSWQCAPNPSAGGTIGGDLAVTGNVTVAGTLTTSVPAFRVLAGPAWNDTSLVTFSGANESYDAGQASMNVGGSFAAASQRFASIPLVTAGVLQPTDRVRVRLSRIFECFTADCDINMIIEDGNGEYVLMQTYDNSSGGVHLTSSQGAGASINLGRGTPRQLENSVLVGGGDVSTWMWTIEYSSNPENWASRELPAVLDPSTGLQVVLQGGDAAESYRLRWMEIEVDVY